MSLAIVCAALLTDPVFGRQQAAVQASLVLQSKLAALLPTFMQAAATYLEAAGQAADEVGARQGSGAGGSAGGTTASSAAGPSKAAGASGPGTAKCVGMAITCLQLVTAPCLASGVQRMMKPTAAGAQQLEPLLRRWLAESAAVLQAIPDERLRAVPAAQFALLLLQAVAAAAHPYCLAAPAEQQSGTDAQARLNADVTGAIWGRHAVLLLPHLARVLPVLRRDSELATQLAAQLAAGVAAACSSVAVVADTAETAMSYMHKAAMWQAARGEALSLELNVQMLAGAAAVRDAALPLMHFAAELPLLAAGASQPSQLVASAARLAAGCLSLAGLSSLASSAQLRQLLAAHGSRRLELCAALQQHQLPAQLRREHITARRLAHCVAGAAEQQLAAVPALSNWPAIFTCGSVPFRAIAELALGPAAGLWDAR